MVAEISEPGQVAGRFQKTLTRVVRFLFAEQEAPSRSYHSRLRRFVQLGRRDNKRSRYPSFLTNDNIRSRMSREAWLLHNPRSLYRLNGVERKRLTSVTGFSSLPRKQDYYAAKHNKSRPLCGQAARFAGIVWRY